MCSICPFTFMDSYSLSLHTNLTCAHTQTISMVGSTHHFYQLHNVWAGYVLYRALVKDNNEILQVLWSEAENTQGNHPIKSPPVM